MTQLSPISSSISSSASLLSPFDHRVALLSPSSRHILLLELGGLPPTTPQPSDIPPLPFPLLPTSYLWPPANLPPGLWRSVILRRTKSQYKYYIANTLYISILVIQLCLGASMTALASRSRPSTSTITASIDRNDGISVALMLLGVIQTINAGIVALMHHAGMPVRFRVDRGLWERLEGWMREIMTTGIVKARTEHGKICRDDDGAILGVSLEDTLAECYERFKTVEETVRDNSQTGYASFMTLFDHGRYRDRDSGA